MYHVDQNPISARFDYELLDDEDPFEVDTQLAHIFKHATLGLEDIYEVWADKSAVLPGGTPASTLAAYGRGARQPGANGSVVPRQERELVQADWHIPCASAA
jgi:hypothetical protein